MGGNQRKCVAVSSSDIEEDGWEKWMTVSRDVQQYLPVIQRERMGEMELSKFKGIMSEKFSELMENIDPHI